MMICATHEAVISLGIYGKVHHWSIVVLANKTAGLQCGLVQHIYGAYNLVDHEEQYSLVPHNDISVNDGPHV
jgi:hypothetical protein